MNNIKALRKQMKMTQSELAALCNVSQGSLSGYENGRFEPDNSTLIKLAEIFNVSIDVILGHENPPDNIRATPIDSLVSQKIEAAGISTPKTSEARILSAGVDRMPAKDRERALNMVRLMFDQYEEYFTERNDDDDSQR